MKIPFLFILIIILFSIKYGNCIVKGLKAMENDFPIAVSLMTKMEGDENLKHFCGGIYLGENWILSAAHCVGTLDPKSVLAQIGGEQINYTSTLDKYEIDKIFSLKLDPYTMKNDVALLQIQTSVDPAKINRLKKLNKIIKKSFTLSTNFIKNNFYSNNKLICYIIGYGSNKFGGNSVFDLHYGHVELIGFRPCSRLLGPVVAPPDQESGMFCAYSRHGVDACQGDSGSALICEKNNSKSYVILGIISYGMGCGVQNIPSVYTNISYHMNYIESIINIHNYRSSK
uniref:Putative trypsin-like serine protease n=1 Tax=Corethrella appendiculata TaxID=1370023 RepID=U5EQV5_9DIPT